MRSEKVTYCEKLMKDTNEIISRLDAKAIGGMVNGVIFDVSVLSGLRVTRAMRSKRCGALLSRKPRHVLTSLGNLYLMA